jgi:mRNA deadenylase 3'-5' endonuclease subunit Ccr4
MSFNEYFHDFCSEHGYTGKFILSKTSEEYEIIISKGDDNAGVFLSRDELKRLNNHEIKSLLEFLHKGFVLKFSKKC